MKASVNERMIGRENGTKRSHGYETTRAEVR
jgi:hypothetical protein